MKNFVFFTLLVISSSLAKADGILSGSETIKLPPATLAENNTDCRTSAVLTIDYDKLTALIQETVTSGTCPTIDPNGMNFKIDTVRVSIDEKYGVGFYLAGHRNVGDGLFFMRDNRKWTGPLNGSPFLQVDADGGDHRYARWDVEAK